MGPNTCVCSEDALPAVFPSQFLFLLNTLKDLGPCGNFLRFLNPSLISLLNHIEVWKQHVLRGRQDSHRQPLIASKLLQKLPFMMLHYLYESNQREQLEVPPHWEGTAWIPYCFSLKPLAGRPVGLLSTNQHLCPERLICSSLGGNACWLWLDRPTERTKFSNDDLTRGD